MVFQGTTNVYTLDMFPMLDTLLGEKQGGSLKATKIDYLDFAHNSNLTLCLNNGVNKRITLRLEINDFLVKSILKTFNVILPATLYESLYQDFIEILMKSNIEALQY